MVQDERKSVNLSWEPSYVKCFFMPTRNEIDEGDRNHSNEMHLHGAVGVSGIFSIYPRGWGTGKDNHHTLHNFRVRGDLHSGFCSNIYTEVLGS